MATLKRWIVEVRFKDATTFEVPVKAVGMEAAKAEGKRIAVNFGMNKPVTKVLAKLYKGEPCLND